MTKDARVNPDSLYPKNLGYQFRGYTLGESSIPTFMYQSGTIEIEDRSVALTANGKVTLKRHLQFRSPVQQSVWFRAFTGDIKLESGRVFKSGKLRITIPQAEAILRPLPNDPKSSERPDCYWRKDGVRVPMGVFGLVAKHLTRNGRHETVYHIAKFT